MEFETCAVLLTENCNACCKMCCDSRGVVRGKTLSEQEISFILNEIKETSVITHIGLTGGEPMLYPNLISKILDFDFGRKVTITIKTNGFWGKNIKEADEFISQYRQKIAHISMSYDEFHKQFIDVEYIKNIITLCKKYNISSDVVGCFLKDSVTLGEIIDDLGEAAYLTRFLYQPVIQTGSGTCFKKESYIKILDTDTDEIRCIATAAPSLLVTPKLEVFPCCSQVIENTILKVGNLHECTMADVVLAIKQNYVFNTIFVHGFTPYIKLLQQYDFDYPKKLASPCELCEFIFKDDNFLRLLDKIKYYENL
ncbi:MAG: radical SAM protein [Treponema sp.]